MPQRYPSHETILTTCASVFNRYRHLYGVRADTSDIEIDADRIYKWRSKNNPAGLITTDCQAMATYIAYRHTLVWDSIAMRFRTRPAHNLAHHMSAGRRPIQRRCKLAKKLIDKAGYMQLYGHALKALIKDGYAIHDAPEWLIK